MWLTSSWINNTNSDKIILSFRSAFSMRSSKTDPYMTKCSYKRYWTNTFSNLVINLKYKRFTNVSAPNAITRSALPVWRPLPFAVFLSYILLPSIRNLVQRNNSPPSYIIQSINNSRTHLRTKIYYGNRKGRHNHLLDNLHLLRRVIHLSTNFYELMTEFILTARKNMIFVTNIVQWKARRKLSRYIKIQFGQLHASCI